MTIKQSAGLVGFAFAAAWIGFDFGSALLCLLGAAAFYAAAAAVQGDLDLADLQARVTDRGRGSGYAPPPRPRGRVR